MVKGKKVVVVLPAFNAEKTLKSTYAEIPRDIVDGIILVDDASQDRTAGIAAELGIEVINHARNLGYGGNQKTCYSAALRSGADIVVMLHPDYQYNPRLITAMAHLIESGEFDVVLGSRILGGQAMKGGMPVYKYVSNRILTLCQNILVGAKLSEYHTGYRAFTRKVLETIPWLQNSNGFLFDNQMLLQVIYRGFRIAEVTSPARYFPESSSISFERSLAYGIGCLSTALRFRLHRLGIIRSSLFDVLDND